MYRILLAILLAALLPQTATSGEFSAVETRPTPVLDVVDLDGDEVGLGEFEGKVVLINFWASWCTPCLEEMPSLIRLREGIGDSRFEILAVNVEEVAFRVRQVAKRFAFNFPVLLDRKGEAYRSWKIKAFPTSFLIDGKRRIRFRALGPIDWDGPEAVEAVNRLLGEL